MMNSLKFILSTQLKRSRINKKIGGFTLIELLIAMVLAVLVITPLMAFMINILDSDRREQAKTTTEQEIQAALDYITRDLQQAVYIYDSDGVTRNQTATDTTLWGIKDQIPPVKTATGCNNASNCTPVLVFWKREFLADSVGVSSPTDTQKDDGFVYSLVAYYLITNPTSSSPWSPAARIGRFQIRGKVNAANAIGTPATSGTAAASGTPAASDLGFNRPPLDKSGNTLKNKMNQWQTSLTASQSYDQPVLTLVDYISTSSPGVTCSTGQGIGTNTNGFYTCVNASEVLAQVYLRGNSLVRLNNNNNTTYSNSASAYFPAANIRVQGRGFLLTK